MTDLEFLDRAEAALRAIELACDRINEDSDADVDNQRVGGMVTLVFANRSQIVVNLQKPLHEIWMAARSGGYHYKWDGLAWVDTKGQGEDWEKAQEMGIGIDPNNPLYQPGGKPAGMAAVAAAGASTAQGDVAQHRDVVPDFQRCFAGWAMRGGQPQVEPWMFFRVAALGFGQV